MRSPSRVWTKPRANRNAATINHTVVFEKPTSASWMVKRPRMAPAVIATTPIAPEGSGRHINADTVAANSDSRPQPVALNPAGGTSQIAAATAGGTHHRQSADGAVGPGDAVPGAVGDSTEVRTGTRRSSPLDAGTRRHAAQSTRGE